MNILNKTVITKSKKETVSLGKLIGNKLNPGDCLLLSGDLGAGKTTLIQGIGKGLNIRKILSSPTFTLVKEYPVSKTSNFIHMDLYRIKSKEEFTKSGMNEYVNATNICAIEWADKITDYFRKGHYYYINIAYINRNNRKIHIRKRSY